MKYLQYGTFLLYISFYMLVKLVKDANGEHLVVFYTYVIHKYVYKKRRYRVMAHITIMTNKISVPTRRLYNLKIHPYGTHD